MSRALLIQLARLGDLIQSLPVITSLHTRFPDQPLDLLCAPPLVPLARLFPFIERVYPWEGEQWRALSMISTMDCGQQLEAADRYLSDLAFPDYSVAYNLNNHPRSIVAAHLLSERVIGAGDQGPLHVTLPAWVAYLRQVAADRGSNRIHLADAFCGICDMKPPMTVSTIPTDHVELPPALSRLIQNDSLQRIGIILGAGDADRRVPLATWRSLIEACVADLPKSIVLLLGGPGEREAGLALETQLSSHLLPRIHNCVGRTTLPELAQVFNHCQWIIGSDTGPLHLAVACGARVIGWYFSRARVHETGPYGVGHYVWQYQKGGHPASNEAHCVKSQSQLPCSWPVMETLQIIQNQRGDENTSEWELWNSNCDEWGVFYTNGEKSEISGESRAEVWRRLGPEIPHTQVPSNRHAIISR
jgi:ADP-heptose:LPS heptosyltransferase